MGNLLSTRASSHSLLTSHDQVDQPYHLVPLVTSDVDLEKCANQLASMIRRMDPQVDVSAFFATLHSVGGVIAGSAVVQCLLDVVWPESDLDIWVPAVLGSSKTHTANEKDNLDHTLVIGKSHPLLQPFCKLFDPSWSLQQSGQYPTGGYNYHRLRRAIEIVVTVGTQVQVIGLRRSTAFALASFDFEALQLAFDGRKFLQLQTSEHKEAPFRQLLQRRLQLSPVAITLQNSHDEWLRTCERMAKYAHRGFNVEWSLPAVQKVVRVFQKALDEAWLFPIELTERWNVWQTSIMEASITYEPVWIDTGCMDNALDAQCMRVKYKGMSWYCMTPKYVAARRHQMMRVETTTSVDDTLVRCFGLSSDQCKQHKHCGWHQVPECVGNTCTSVCRPRDLLLPVHVNFLDRRGVLGRYLNLRRWAQEIDAVDVVFPHALVLEPSRKPRLQYFPGGLLCASQAKFYKNWTDMETRALRLKTFAVLRVTYRFNRILEDIDILGQEDLGEAMHVVAVFLFRDTIDVAWRLNVVDPNNDQAHTAGVVRRILPILEAVGIAAQTVDYDDEQNPWTEDGVKVNCCFTKAFTTSTDRTSGLCFIGLCWNLALVLFVLQSKGDKPIVCGTDIYKAIKKGEEIVVQALRHQKQRKAQKFFEEIIALMD